MIDHVTIRVGNLASSRRFYECALALLETSAEFVEADGFVEWNDFSLAQADGEHRVTRRLHVAFQAPTRVAVDRWWRELTGRDYDDDGAPGARPEYGPDYYGAFVRDPDGSSVEAVHNGPPRGDGTLLDHLWLRVRDLEAATRFYDAVSPIVGYRVTRLPGRTRVHGDGASFSLVAGEPTECLHLAFSAPDVATVRAFHEAGVRADAASLGRPGERPQYHRGYFGAYLADPDDNNIEAVHHDRPAGS